jgi:hypothetical protein
VNSTTDRFHDPQARIERFSLAAHRLVMKKLYEDPQRVGVLQSTLTRWRTQRGLTHSEPYMQEWERLLRMPLNELERLICADNDHATVLRSVSPFGSLLTSEERNRLLLEVRNQSADERQASQATP